VSFHTRHDFLSLLVFGEEQLAGSRDVEYPNGTHTSATLSCLARKTRSVNGKFEVVMGKGGRPESLSEIDFDC